MCNRGHFFTQCVCDNQSLMVSNDCDILMLHCVTLGFQQTNLLAKSDPLSLKEKSKVFKYAKMTIEMIDK